MRWIKKYESLDKEGFYKEITVIEYNQLYYNSKLVLFDVNYQKMINDYLKRYSYMVYNIESYTNSNIKYSYLSSKPARFVIYQFDDEYFLLGIDDINMKKERFFFIDQIDGLLSFFNDNLKKFLNT